VAEERVAALASVRRDKSFWTRWLLVGVPVAEKKSFVEEREKRCNHHVRWFDGFLWWR
jgi:hypothetical protein